MASGNNRLSWPILLHRRRDYQVRHWKSRTAMPVVYKPRFTFKRGKVHSAA